MFGRRLTLIACGLWAAVFAGCGSSEPKLYPASGTVTYEGKPLADATILFIPQGGRPSMGTTDASGKYTITTNAKPGVPVGTYSVTVSKSVVAGSPGSNESNLPAEGTQVTEEEIKKMRSQMDQQMMQMQNQPRAKPAIPAKYSLPEGSGLSAIVTVDASKNVFDFELTP